MGLKCILLVPNLHLRICCCWNTKMFNSQCIRHICVVVNVYRWQYSTYISTKRYFIIVSFQVCESLICYLLVEIWLTYIYQKWWRYKPYTQISSILTLTVQLKLLLIAQNIYTSLNNMCGKYEPNTPHLKI